MATVIHLGASREGTNTTCEHIKRCEWGKVASQVALSVLKFFESIASFIGCKALAMAFLRFQDRVVGLNPQKTKIVETCRSIPGGSRWRFCGHLLKMIGFDGKSLDSTELSDNYKMEVALRRLFTDEVDLSYLGELMDSLDAFKPNEKADVLGVLEKFEPLWKRHGSCYIDTMRVVVSLLLPLPAEERSSAFEVIDAVIKQCNGKPEDVLDVLVESPSQGMLKSLDCFLLCIGKQPDDGCETKWSNVDWTWRQKPFLESFLSAMQDKEQLPEAMSRLLEGLDILLFYDMELAVEKLGETSSETIHSFVEFRGKVKEYMGKLPPQSDAMKMAFPDSRNIFISSLSFRWKDLPLNADLKNLKEYQGLLLDFITRNNVDELELRDILECAFTINPEDRERYLKLIGMLFPGKRVCQLKYFVEECYLPQRDPQALEDFHSGITSLLKKDAETSEYIALRQELSERYSQKMSQSS